MYSFDFLRLKYGMTHNHALLFVCFLTTDATRGGCLSIKRDGAQGQEREEVVFSYNDRVDEITGNDFRNIIANFVETAVALRTQLVSER